MASRDPADWMWAQALGMLEQAERLQRETYRPGPGRRQQPSWEPPVDIIETETALVILVALPGVSPDQIEVSVEGGTLLVSGQCSFPVERGTRARIHRLEIPYGQFERRIGLPDTPLTLGERYVANGTLVLTLHKSGAR